MSSDIKTHYAKFLERLNTIAVINYKLVLGKEYDLLPTVIENQKQFIDSKISSISKYTGEIGKDIMHNISDAIVSVISVHKIFKFNEKTKLEDSI